MTCKRCEIRGQTWKGSAPKCGFTNGVFTEDNWNCGTLNELRDHASEIRVWNNEQSLASLVIPDEGDVDFILLGWYKNRGKTANASAIRGSQIHPLNLATAEEYLEKEKMNGVNTK